MEEKVVDKMFFSHRGLPILSLPRSRLLSATAILGQEP
jgi:hypothetical protein